MCELTEVTYMPGDVVWVKLGSCWWPGEVKDMEALPEEIMSALKKKPLAVVKFFGEDSYEYVKNLDSIYHYNNRRKLEFIKKGMDLTRSKSKQGSSIMDKFPTDVVTAESLTKGDVNILTTVAFVPEERPQYKDLFGNPKKKTPKKSGAGRPSTESKFSSDRKAGNSIFGKAKPLIQLKQRITHPRFTNASDHEVRIRQQPSASNTPEAEQVNHPYKCQQCDFGTSRQNVFILHCKAHRDNIIKPGTYMKTPSTAPSKNKRVPKSTPSRKVTAPKSAPAATITSRERKSTPKDTSVSAARRKIFQSGKKSLKKGGKEAQTSSPIKSAEAKERDLEKRNTILADWGDEDEEEEEKEFKKIKLELDEKEAERNETPAKRCIPITVKSVTKGDAPVAATPSCDPSSIYDLIDDADEFIPPPRLSESKRVLPELAAVPTESADTREIDDEVANLLEETAVPILPQVPSISKASLKPESVKFQTINIPVERSAQNTSASMEVAVSVPSSEPCLERVNGVLKTSVADGIPSEVMTVPASTLSTVISPSASKTNSNGASNTTLVHSQTSEVAEDPNTETATYVLVTIDDSGGFQQFQTLEGMGNTTLLAYDSSQGEEGGTRTLYIDPSQLGGSASGLENLFLAIDASDGSGTSMVQLQPQQVTLQVGEDSNSIISSEELSKSKQDILAVALANTQVLQSSSLEAGVGNDAVVKVTNAAQSPVMTPRVAESQITPQSKVTTIVQHNNETTGAITQRDEMGALR